MTKLTENFTLDEFACNDGTPVPTELFENVEQLAKNLQVLRDALGVPIFVNSGYRTPTYNASVGGATRSQHLLAKAADIVVRGYTPTQVADTIEMLIATGEMQEGGLGRYNTFTHYDVRKIRSRWQG